MRGRSLDGGGVDVLCPQARFSVLSVESVQLQNENPIICTLTARFASVPYLSGSGEKQTQLALSSKHCQQHEVSRRSEQLSSRVRSSVKRVPSKVRVSVSISARCSSVKEDICGGRARRRESMVFD